MENNFEKYIKNSMDNPPDFPFDERLWKDMESRLDNDGKKKPFMGFVGRLPLLLLALLTTSLAGYFYSKQYNATERIAAMEQLLQNQQILKTDSAIEKRVTVIFDTIYNRIVVDQVQSQNNWQRTDQSRGQQYSNQNKFALDLDIQALSRVFNATNTHNAKWYGNTNHPNHLSWANAYPGNAYVSGPRLGLQSNSDQKTGIAAIPFDWKTPSSTIPSLLPSLLEIKRRVNLPLIKTKEVKRRKKVVFYLHKLKPTRFSLAGTTGSFTSLNLGGNGFNLRGSAIAEVGLGKRFSLVFGTEYFSNDFNRKIAINEEIPLEGFPNLPPNNAEDVLTSVQGDFNYLQIPFGVKYIIFPRRYFYPYLSAGLIAGRTTRSRLEYDYLSMPGPNEIEYSTSRGNLLPRNFELNAFFSTLGIEIQMNRNWSLLLEGGFQFDFDKGDYKYEDLQLLKLSTGVQYEF